SYVDGTFEGYVPTPTDLYVRGNNVIGFSKTTSYDLPNFESGQLTIASLTSGMEANINLTGFSRINFEIRKTNELSGRSIVVRLRSDPSRYAKLVLDGALNTTQTVSLEIGTLAISGLFRFEFIDWRGAIYRIWIS
uniref:hypothetical protein n=1 Tax=Hungatella hathewayi TaxID=154046 RepID=UPI003569CB41